MTDIVFDSPLSHYQAGLAAYQQADYAQAVSLFSGLWETSEPVHQDTGAVAFTELSQLLQMAGRTAEDLDWQLDFYYLSGLMLVHCHINLGQAEMAIPYLQALTERYAPQPQLHHFLSTAYLLTEQRQKAVIQLNRALEINPDYIQAYEDLAWIANQNRDFDLALRVLEVGLAKKQTPKLFEELLSCSAQSDFIDFRRVFVELCVRHIQVKTFPLLKQLCQGLYRQEDMQNTEYLARYLLEFAPNDEEIGNLFVLAALHNQNYAAALQCLLSFLPQTDDAAEHWYKLGVAYQRWQMPLFARHAFYQTLQITEIEALQQLAHEQLQQLPDAVSLDSCLNQILKMAGVYPLFRQNLREMPQATLENYGIGWSEELANTLKKVAFFT